MAQPDSCSRFLLPILAPDSWARFVVPIFGSFPCARALACRRRGPGQPRATCVAGMGMLVLLTSRRFNCREISNGQVFLAIGKDKSDFGENKFLIRPQIANKR
jgi:hypothetical protein